MNFARISPKIKPHVICFINLLYSKMFTAFLQAITFPALGFFSKKLFFSNICSPEMGLWRANVILSATTVKASQQVKCHGTEVDGLCCALYMLEYI